MSNMEKVRISVVGLGGRGYGLMKMILNMQDVDVTAVCDEYEDRAEEAAKTVEEARGVRPFVTTDAKEAIHRDDVDAVMVFTAWEPHIALACEAMEAGKAVAMEVGGAYSVDDCWKLVHTQEETQAPFMLMENCCFNREELLVTAMVRKGLFGEVVHCAGAYGHDLRGEVAEGEKRRHYRLRNYLNRNCENYPTHELGPIAKLLNVNRGNRLVSLVSVASKARGLKQYISEHEELSHLKDAEFAQGDIVTTVITCAGGETITLRLDTTLPRFYNREFTVRGTKAMYEQGAHIFYRDGMPEYFETVKTYRENIGNIEQYADEYLPTVWKEMTEEGRKAGHGGMDGIEFRVFFDCLKEGKPMPIDVYDCASWMVVTCLSEQSIKMGGMPQSIPDFTNGNWLRRPPEDVLPL